MKAGPPALPSTGVLSGVSVSAREALTSFGSFTPHGRGSVVVEQGGPAGALHIVVDGELQVMLHTPDELVPLGYVQEGETVGEMGFLDENAIASAAVTARMPSLVWTIGTDAFEAFLDTHPVAGTEILKAILKLVGQRARKGNERLADEIEEQAAEES
jgi:CRP-like cAMP-binding protein